MKTLTMLLVLFTMALTANTQGALFQTQTQIPNMQGIKEYSVASNFMSLPCFLRWQYFTENVIWIGLDEAQQLVNAQARIADEHAVPPSHHSHRKHPAGH